MFEDDYREEEGTEIVGRYEQLKKSRSPIFFDVDEFGSIIDFYLRNNQLKSANEATELAADLHPDSVEIQLKRTQLLIGNARYTEAMELLTDLRRKHPGYFEIHLQTGIIHIATKNLAAARICLEKSLSCTISQDERIDIWLAFAREYMAQSYRDDAFTCFEKAMLLDDAVEDYHDFAEFCLSNEKYDEAIEVLNMMLDKEPFHVNGWLNLAGACIYTRRDNEALEAVEYALAIKPDDAFALYLAGLCHFNTEDNEKALDFCYRSLNIDSESLNTLRLVSDILWQSKDPSEAKPYLVRYIELAPQDAEAFFMLGTICRQNSRERFKYFRKAIALDDQNVHYLTAMSHEYIISKNYTKAQTYALDALQADDQSDRAWIVNSVCEYYLNSPAEAWKCIISAIRRAEKVQMSLWLHLSFYCFSMGRLRAGWRYYYKAVAFQSASFFPPVLTDYFEIGQFSKFIQFKKNN
jgi:tetratricopeptide (TPR) repeat protein